MYTNPMWKKPTPRKFPLNICCVLDDTFYTNSRISDIRSYAHSLGASFTLREYDAFKFSADRKYVERLPAFHIYIDKSRDRTIYLDSEVKPEDHIDECVHLFLDKEERRAMGFLAWIKSLFQRSRGRSRAILRSTLK
jgi:hypothetical protein